MQYRMFRSIIASNKEPITLASDSDSFFVKRTHVDPYIEPNFSKIDFPKEKPSILLVSAIGASGKTTVAQAISFDIQLPILDLAKHKAVGDNTLTGILTTAYPLNAVGTVLKGLQHGKYGIIIDGIDEGRTKTTEQGFEAFLDDLIQRSDSSAATAIIVFGRSQVILNTWIYLEDKGANVGLVQLDPFSIEQAKEYIDSHIEGRSSGQNVNYAQARDLILTKLSAAFSAVTHKEKDDQDPFLSFIGYPPVLDAISTLLQAEKNYHNLLQSLEPATNDRLEIKLLVDISEYLLKREHKDKALPNFIDEIANDASPELGQEFRRSLYIAEEQCARVLSRALGRQFPRRIIEDDSLNERYESAVGEWCNDHPFLEEDRVRNVVFAAFAVARCALSNISEYHDLAHSYVVEHQSTYHFLYIFHELAHDTEIEVRYFNTLIQSGSESVGVNANISAEITGTAWEESDDELQEIDTDVELVITIEFPDKDQARTFVFSGKIDGAESIPMGPYLVNASVIVPCAVHLTGPSVIESIGSCSISARRVSITAPALTLRRVSRQSTDIGAELFINARSVEGHVNEVSNRGGLIEIQCSDHELSYPLAKYVKIKRTVAPTKDAILSEKYRRLRRIFSEFASHGKGGLAKYRQKIEHERVLRGDIGRCVLNALVSEQILSMDTKFYHVNMNEFSAKLGISWRQLRTYETSDKLDIFLRKI